jgi:hypothetical protein
LVSFALESLPAECERHHLVRGNLGDLKENWRDTSMVVVPV